MLSRSKQKICKNLIWIGFALALFVPGHLYAEEAEFESAPVDREIEAVELAEALIQKGKEKRFRDKLAKISYEEVLADPDNFELNYQYAQQQVRDNNLLGAAATLERILLVNPDLAQIRLFYAIVLFRLDNLVEAQNELERLGELEMPDSLRKELNLYLKEIKKRQRRTRLGVRQTIGWQMDSNRNAAPSSKRRLFFELPLGLQLSNTKQRDTSFLNVTTVDGAIDLGFQAGHELIGSFTYYQGEQALLDSLDINSFQYELGGVFKSRFFHFQPTFEHTIVYLSRQIFLRTQAAKFKLSKDTKRVDLYSQLKVERQDYRRISENATADDRKGRLIHTETGAKWKILPTMQVLTAIGYDNKSAESDVEAYQRMTLKLNHTWVLWRGHFLVNGMTVNFDYYDEPNRAVAGRYRKDKGLRYRLTYGAPLGTIPVLGRIFPGPLSSVVLTGTYELFRSSSNITSFTYTNHKGQVMLTKKFNF